MLKTSNYNYFHTCNWLDLQVEITDSFKNMKIIHADMLEWFQKWYQNSFFASFREQHSPSFSPRIQQPFVYFDTSRIPRIHRASISYFLQMLLHNGRLSAQTLVVTIKATTVDRLNNDWSSNTVSGIQQKQNSTCYLFNLNLAKRPHCQLTERATSRRWVQLVSLGGAISVIFGSQVSIDSQVSFWIVQNHGEKCYFRTF